MKNRIVQIRKEAKLNQTKFAEELGLSRVFISLVETGDRELSKRSISDICKKFNVNETWLLTGEGEMHAPLTRTDEIAHVAADLYNLDPESLKYKMIMKLDNLNDDQWELIKNVIDMFSDIK